MYYSYFLGECRQLAFPSFFFFADKRLVNHPIKNVSVPDLDACELLCYQENNCVSVNFNSQAIAGGTYRCELNNATHRGHDGDFVSTEGFFYHGADVSIEFKSPPPTPPPSPCLLLLLLLLLLLPPSAVPPISCSNNV